MDADERADRVEEELDALSAPEATDVKHDGAPSTPIARRSTPVGVLYVLSPNVLTSIRLRVNGQPVPVAVTTQSDTKVVEATIPASALRGSPDTQSITSAVVLLARSVDPLGLANARLDVDPAGQPYANRSRSSP